MPAAHGSLLERITIDPDVRFGKPCIRGHRITVQEILEWLSGGVSQKQILADYPQLEPDDLLAGLPPSFRVARDSAGISGKIHLSPCQVPRTSETICELSAP